ncbi:MAG: hypothetical protein ACHQPI_02900 [Thermoanaerobaculia bacterium]
MPAFSLRMPQGATIDETRDGPDGGTMPRKAARASRTGATGIRLFRGAAGSAGWLVVHQRFRPS